MGDCTNSTTMEYTKPVVRRPPPPQQPANSRSGGMIVIDESRDILCGREDRIRQRKPNIRYENLLQTKFHRYALRVAGMWFLKRKEAVPQGKGNSLGGNAEAAAELPSRWIALNDEGIRKQIDQAMCKMLAAVGEDKTGGDNNTTSAETIWKPITSSQQAVDKTSQAFREKETASFISSTSNSVNNSNNNKCSDKICGVAMASSDSDRRDGVAAPAGAVGAAAARTRMRVEHHHHHHQQQQHQQLFQQQVYRRHYHHEQLQQQQQKLHALRQRQQQHYYYQQQQQQHYYHHQQQQQQHYYHQQQQQHYYYYYQQQQQILHASRQRQQQHLPAVVRGHNTIHNGDTLLSCNDEEEEDNIADNFGDNAVSSDVDSYSYSGNNANLGHHKDGTSPAWPPTPHQLQQSKTAATVARTKTTTTVAAAARTTKRKAEPSLDEHPSKTKLSRSTIRNTSTSSIAIAAGVVSPRHHDIICGQGSSWIKNPGTVWYRTLIERYTKEHPVLAEQGKTHLAEIIFQAIRSPLKEDEDGSSSSSSCGRRRRRRRFLRRSKATDRWYEISEDKAKEKIRQALCVAELKTTRQHHAVRCSSHPLLQRGGPELVSQKSMNDCEHTATNSSTNRSHLTDDIAFPFKLHSILEYAEKTNRVDIISWLPSGDAFKIHKPQDFADTIMQQYFNQTKYRSFQRQLNIYNFDRVTDKASNEYGAYAHELFIRGHSDLCVNMTRQKIKGTGLSNEKRHYLASAKRALSYPKQTHEMQVAKAIIAKEIRAKKDEKSGMILPEASLEVDFDVRNPPLEPSTPASKHPICESPADVNSFDVTTEEVEDDEETENTKRTIDDNNAFDTTIIVKTKKSRISISTESVGAYLDEDPLIFVHDDEVDDDDDDDDNDDDENLFIII